MITQFSNLLSKIKYSTHNYTRTTQNKLISLFTINVFFFIFNQSIILVIPLYVQIVIIYNVK